MDKCENIRLSIIIVSYNSIDYLKNCLNSIIKNPPLPDREYKIIVVDNASVDGSRELVKNQYPDVRLIANPKNTGFSAANNIGIRANSSEYILLINSDCEAFENSIENLVFFMDDNKDAGIAGPKIVNSDGSIQLSCRRFPSFFDAGMHSILEHIVPDNRFSRRYKLADIKRDKPVKVDWVSGSCMIIRRQALDDTGFLDEHFFMYVEDTDLCYQMWKKDWKVYYNPHSRILHHSGGSTRGRKTAASIMMQKSVIYFFWKNYRKTWRVILFPILPVLSGLRILLTFIKNSFKIT